MTGKGIFTRSRRHLACATYNYSYTLGQWLWPRNPRGATKAVSLEDMQQNLRSACTVWSLVSTLAWQEELRSCSLRSLPGKRTNRTARASQQLYFPCLRLLQRPRLSTSTAPQLQLYDAAVYHDFARLDDIRDQRTDIVPQPWD